MGGQWVAAGQGRFAHKRFCYNHAYLTLFACGISDMADVPANRLKPCSHNPRVSTARSRGGSPVAGTTARSLSGWGLTCVALTSLLSGCIYIPSKTGTGHVLVVGIGVVSVNDRTNQALVATSTHVLGMQVSDRPGLKFGLGYASGVVTTVSDGAEDVRAEISQCPFGPLTVTVQNATLSSPTNQTQESENLTPKP